MPRSFARAGMLNLFLATLAASVSILFGLFTFINALHIRFYYLYTPKTVNIVIFSPSVDLWVWIVSLLFIVFETVLMRTLRNLRFPRWTILPFLSLFASLAVFPFNDGMAQLLAAPSGLIVASLLLYYGDGHLIAKREEAVPLALLCVAGPLILFELASTSSWLLNALNYEVPFSSTLRWKFPLIDLQLFSAPYPLTSWLLMAFLYSWIWIPAAKYTFARIPGLRTKFPGLARGNSTPAQSTDPKTKLNRKLMALGLLLSAAAAALITYYPYIHLPSPALVGADSAEYYSWLTEMIQRGPLTALERDRPLFSLFMYSVQRATLLSPATVIRIMPALLGVCLSLAVFWLVKVGTKNELAALISSLFTSFSFQTTVGVFAAFLANWLALIEAFVLLVFLLESLEKRSWRRGLASAVIGIAVLLTHPYTWDALMVILLAYLAWILWRKRSEGAFGIKLLTFLLAANLFFYAAYSLTPFGKGVSSGAGGIVQSYASSLSISNLLNLQSGLASLVQEWVGGLFANPLLIALAVAGMLSMFDFTKRFNRFMLLWVMVPSIALLAVSLDPFYVRLTYLIPFQVQAAAGLYWVIEKLEKEGGRFKTNETFRMLTISIVVLVVLFLLNYSLRSVDEALIQML